MAIGMDTYAYLLTLVAFKLLYNFLYCLVLRWFNMPPLFSSLVQFSKWRYGEVYEIDSSSRKHIVMVLVGERTLESILIMLWIRALPSI